MRIVSKFHDYYDKGQTSLPDSLNYIRMPEEVSIDGKTTKLPFPTISFSYYSGTRRRLAGFDGQQYMVGFCGVVYPVLRLACAKRDGQGITQEIVEFCYTIDAVDAYIKRNFSRKAYEEWGTKFSKKRWPRLVYWDRNECKENLDRFFNECKEVSGKFSEMFVAKHCPVFIVNYSRPRWMEVAITYNGCLRDVEFYRLFDTFTAYQEIEMFLNNMASPQKEMPVVPDETNAESHGFDKWSFRKEPAKKRK